MDDYNLKVLTNIIGAVESGGQIYGKRNYAAYAGPYTNTPNEKTITLGWAQNYGPAAEELVKMILKADPAIFHKLDTCTPSIESMLSKDWTAIRWNPSTSQKKVLISLIDSEAGRKCQDELFIDSMRKTIAQCEKDYTSDPKAVMMYCEIKHLGGKSAADRIFKRCNGNYSLDNIMTALAADQRDTSSENQVGDKKFWSRHVKCYQFINEYAKEEGENVASPLSRAKTLLRQPQNKTMTGYTPTGAGYFKSANAWTTIPKKGYVVYFYGKPSGEGYRICHTGIVESVNTSAKTFTTIEGNTSSAEFTTNGGSVARHTYSYKNVGGTNRVNGFGIPDFSGAGVTADQFVKTAASYIGYEEKKSNAYLDDFHKNAGRNNYQKFQRDVTGSTGDQWCQYFVDAIALYTAQGTKGDGGSSTKKEEVTCMVELKELKKGSTGSAVKTLQILLINKFHISCGSAGADGDFGSNTDHAVKNFQKLKNLDADGIVGAKTWTALLR